MALYITEIVVRCFRFELGLALKKHRTSGVIIIYDAFLTLFSFQGTRFHLSQSFDNGIIF